MKRNILIFLSLLFSIACNAQKEKTPETPHPLAYHIPPVQQSTIDGSLQEWANRAFSYQLYSNQFGEKPSPTDFDVKIYLAWSTKGLLVGFEVKDDTIFTNPDPERLWLGDALGIFMTSAKGEKNLAQCMIAPGGTEKFPELRLMKYDFRRKHSEKFAEMKAQAAFQQTPTGYTVEAFMPFENLKISPKKGQEFGLHINAYDADQHRDPNRKSVQWHYATGVYQNPYAVHRIVLAGKPSKNNQLDIKSFMTDTRIAHVRIFGTQAYSRKKVEIRNSQQVFFSGKLRQGKDSLLLDFAMPAPRLTPQYKPMQVFVNDTLRASIDLGIASNRFVYTKPYPFEKAIRIFEFFDRLNSPPKGGVLFVGSSSIRKWETLGRDMQPLTVLNRGFGGSKTQDLLRYFRRVVTPYQPKAVVVYEGDNDLGSRMTPQAIADTCQILLDSLHEALPKARIYLLAVKPSPRRHRLLSKMQQTNDFFKQFAKQREYVEYIDIFSPMMEGKNKIKQGIWEPDMLHMNAEGYKIWTEVVRKRLIDDFAKEPPEPQN